MDTNNKTTKQLMDELVAAAYESDMARGRYEELLKKVRQRLVEMQKQVDDGKQRLADMEEEMKS
jgi:ElaB/YqjD/DUF883 family membrane-anchored ribosome-binding protein